MQVGLPDRITARMAFGPECWLWEGGRYSNGYARIFFEGKYRLGHRLFYETVKGEIPEGKQLDHLCRVRNCCNPLHLEPVSPSVNTLRGDLPNKLRARFKALTHFRCGHERTPENTSIYLRQNGAFTHEKRRCLTCHRAKALARFRKIKGTPQWNQDAAS